MSESERFDRAIERLLADQSPRREIAGLDAEEQQMVQMAQLLRGSAQEGPRPEFVARLKDQVVPSPPRVSRRTAFLSGVSALAAGILAGIGIDRALPGESGRETRPLVGANGKWVRVAHVSEVPPGAVRPFTAGALQGFLVNQNGQVRAISRICTHMGCSLRFESGRQSLVCPCHGAEFGMTGSMIVGPGGYTRLLPSLPPIDVKVHGDHVEVWSI